MHEHSWQITRGKNNPWNRETDAWICTHREYPADSYGDACNRVAIVGCHCGVGFCVDHVPDGDPNDVR